MIKYEKKQYHNVFVSISFIYILLNVELLSLTLISGMLKWKSKPKGFNMKVLQCLVIII